MGKEKEFDESRAFPNIPFTSEPTPKPRESVLVKFVIGGYL